MKPRLISPLAGLGLLLFCFLGGCNQESASAAPELPGWTADYKAALVQAQKEGKAVLLDFTGSDWCPPCILLKREVFGSAVFQDFAKKKLVLVTVDFPKGRPLSAKQTEANRALAEKYGAGEIFPTVIIVDSMGRPLGGVQGYGRTPAADYVQELQRILTEKPAMR